MIEDLERLKRFTRRFSRDLKSRKERLSTTPMFRRLLDIVRTLRTRARNHPVLQDAQTEIERARSVLADLARFYGEVWPPTAAASRALRGLSDQGPQRPRGEARPVDGWWGGVESPD